MFEDEDVCPCVFRVDREDQEVALGTLRRLDLWTRTYSPERPAGWVISCIVCWNSFFFFFFFNFIFFNSCLARDYSSCNMRIIFYRNDLCWCLKSVEMKESLVNTLIVCVLSGPGSQCVVCRQPCGHWLQLHWKARRLCYRCGHGGLRHAGAAQTLLHREGWVPGRSARRFTEERIISFFRETGVPQNVWDRVYINGFAGILVVEAD